MQEKFEQLFLGGMINGEPQEPHNDVDEKIKMKHSDLRLRFEAVISKKKSVYDLQKRYDYVDRMHTEMEEEFQSAIEYQNEKFNEEFDNNHMQEKRLEQKKNDLENLTRQKNDVIDQNYKNKSELNDLKKGIEFKRKENNYLKSLIK